MDTGRFLGQSKNDTPRSQMDTSRSTPRSQIDTHRSYDDRSPLLTSRRRTSQQGPSSPNNPPRSDFDDYRDNALERIMRDDCEFIDNATLDGTEISDPALYMKKLLEYVEIDPDGGILNLTEREQHGAQSAGQHSKVQALHKSTFEQWLAILAFFRSVANPAVVIFFAVRAIHGFFFQGQWIERLERETAGMRIPVTYGKFLLLTSFAELLGVTCLLSMALKHGLQGLCWSSVAVKDHLHPRYIALARFYWQDLPYVQSFSVLTSFAFIHPNLLTKTLKGVSLYEDRCRAKLQRVLRYCDGAVPDTVIVMRVIEAVVHYDYKDDTLAQEQIASKYLDSPPSEVLMLLQTSRLAKDHQELQKIGLNPDAIFGWRFKFVGFVESLVTFFLFVLFTSVGIIGFFTKMVRSFCLLNDPETSAFVAIVFFVAFLNQIIGIIPITRLLQWRVECFLFGGTDALVSSEEAFIMGLYLGSLNEAVWRSNALTTFDKVCIMFQLDDDDLQQLIIEENQRKKSHLVLEVRKHMDHLEENLSFKKQFTAFAKR